MRTENRTEIGACTLEPRGGTEVSTISFHECSTCAFLIIMH